MRLVPILLCMTWVTCQQQWITKTSMPTARSDMYANTIGNLMYVVGGCTVDQSAYNGSNCPSLTNVNEIYDPIADKWTTGTPMNVKRYRHSTAVVGTKLWVITGRDIYDNIINSVEYYDTVTQTWTMGPSLPPIGVTSDGYAYSLGNVVYYVGGYYQNYTPSSVVMSIDTSARNLTWQSNQQGSLNIPRGDLAASVINNIPYIFDGFSFDFCIPLNSTEAYVSNGWNLKAPMKIGRRNSAEAVITIGGSTRFYVIGGETISSDCSTPIPIQEVESYDPSSNSWRFETPIPDARMRFAGDRFNTTIFIFGGQNQVTLANGTKKFNVHAGTYALNIVAATPTPTPTVRFEQGILLTLLFCILNLII